MPLSRSARRAALIAGDLLSCFVLAPYLAGLGIDSVIRGGSILRGSLWVGVFGIWPALASVNRLYELDVAGSLRATARLLVRCGALACAVLGIGFLLVPRSMPRGTLPGAAASIVLVGIWHLAYAALLTRPRFRERVLMVGAGGAADDALDLLERAGGSAHTVLGLVSDGPWVRGEHEASWREVGGQDGLTDLVRRHRISEVVVALEGPYDPGVLTRLLGCRETGVRMTTLTDLFEDLVGLVPLQHVAQDWSRSLPLGNGPEPLRRFAKRALDLVGATAGLSVTLVLLPLIALAIKLDSPGPVIYTQVRVGKNGRLFKLRKFRTMVEDAEPEGPVWAERGDTRVTRVGRLLRSSILDEMPQLWNVIRGEMSLVGPRAERPEFVEKLQREIPFYSLRHVIRPGMAGWALVNQGYGRSVNDAWVKVGYDLHYIKRHSLFLDLVIILRTIGRAVTLRHAEAKPRRAGERATSVAREER